MPQCVTGCPRFILEGLLTFLCALPSWWLIPDFPEDGRVLKELDQKKWMYRLLQNQGVTNVPVDFSWRQVRKAFSDWKVYVYSLMWVANFFSCLLNFEGGD